MELSEIAKSMLYKLDYIATVNNNNNNYYYFYFYFSATKKTFGYRYCL